MLLFRLWRRSSGESLGPEDGGLLRIVSYCVFLSAFIPLVFGGKIYNAIEKIMVTKIILVMGYLTLVGLFMVSWATWVDIFTGFVRFGSMPETEVDWGTLAAFAAIAGAGGLSNLQFSNYTREKGWGMGERVGAIPSIVGGRRITLAHVGKIFPATTQSVARWRGWTKHVLRDQTAVWMVGCILGMALPSLLSLEFIPGVEVEGHAAAALTARGIADRSGDVFWFLTLICGFIVLAPGQISDIDGITRRWTDVIWTGNKRVAHMKGGQVRYVYFTIMAAYCAWGLIALRLTPDPLVLAVVTGSLRNVGLGATSLHTLYINRKLLPEELRLPLHMQIGLVGSFLFFLGISAIAFNQQLGRLLAQ